MPTINPWAILAAIALLAASNTVSYYKGYDSGDSDVRAEWNGSKNAATEKKIDVKAKQDVIKNAPVDVGVTTRRLRSASF